MPPPAGAPVLSPDAMRAAEARAIAQGATQDAMMEAAGTAVAHIVARVAAGRDILVLAGPGNNGGDGYVVARLLAERGLPVRLARLGDPADGAAARMAARWNGETEEIAAARPAAVLVDGLFGIGPVRPFASELRSALDRLRGRAEHVLAIDVPSGITGDHPLRADITVALGALKPVHLLEPTASVCGTVLLGGIGIDCSSSCKTLARPRIGTPARDAHKYTRGMIMVVEGAMKGASRLAAEAALRSGAGYVVLAGDGADGRGSDALVRRDGDLGAVLADERIAAVVVGPRLGRDAAARGAVDRAIAAAHPLVLDGDALSLLGSDGVAQLARRVGPTVLTPHSAEFDRMFGTGSGDKIERTLAAARASGCTIVHKGPDTVIARPDGTVTIATGAPSWLSTAGSGDVLAGIVAARLRPGGADAAAQAVWLHTRAGRLAGPAFAADELYRNLGRAFEECR